MLTPEELNWQLLAAATTGDNAAISRLLAAGADVNAADKDSWTALKVAAAEGHTDTARLLLGAGADVNAADENGWTALMSAASRGHTDTVRLLLDKGVQVNSADQDGVTALIFATQKGHIDIVRLLLDKGADANAASNYGGTALMAAAFNGHMDIVRLLLEKGADVEAGSNIGATALMLAAQNGHSATTALLLDEGANANATVQDGRTALMFAAQNGHTETVALLLDREANVNAADKNGWTALILAAQNGHAAAAALLLDKGADANAATDVGITALMLAAQKGHIATAALLLDKGANINTADKLSSTALVFAAGQGYTDTVRLLLNKGADVNAADDRRWMALMHAASGGHTATVEVLLDKGAEVSASNKNISTALRLAAFNGHVDTARLLLDNGADVSAGDEAGLTALMLAAFKGRIDAARLLLNKGADANAATLDSTTALMFAAQNGHTDAARLLLEKGAAVNAADANGWTALMVAVKNGHTATAKLLLEKGADAKAAKKDGKTALDLAKNYGHDELAGILQSKGAKQGARKDTKKASDASTLEVRPWDIYLLIETAKDTARKLFGLREEQYSFDANAMHKPDAQAERQNDELWQSFRKCILPGMSGDIEYRGATVLTHIVVISTDVAQKFLLWCESDINAPTADGTTALIYAARKNDMRAVAFLLQQNADVWLRDNQGKTALDIAKEKGNSSIAQLLEDVASNVTDAPFVLQPNAPDHLGIDVYARALSKFIKAAKTPFTVAIQGEWGSGKTSLMRHICRELCGDSKEGQLFIKDEDKPFCGVWLDTWECGLMRSAESIQMAVISSLAKAANELGDNTRKIQEFARKAVKPMLLAGSLATVTIPGVTVGSALLNGIDKLINQLGDGGQSVKKFRDELAKVVTHVKGKGYTKGILFFIDDLDRILPTVAVDVLEILKNLFEVDGCIFVLAVDYNVVVKGLKDKLSGSGDEDERAFRSFFDKIIQLPFSMPVSGYEIGDYLDNLLVKIRYYEAQDLKAPINEVEVNGELIKLLDDNTGAGATGQEPKVRDLLQQMVKLSTAKNPRSIKRLVNSLSLIRLILNEKKMRLSAPRKLLCFGIVCMQIAYPRIYDMLLENPDFLAWDEKFAARLGLHPSDNTKESEDNQKQADTKWRKVVELAAQEAGWMEKRSPDICSLLALLAACVPKGENLDDTMREVLTFAATTGTGTGALAPEEEILSREAFLQNLQDKDALALLEQLFKLLDERFCKDSEPLLQMECRRNWIQVRVKHQKESDNVLLGISPDTENDEKIKLCYMIGSSPSEKLEERDVKQGSAFFQRLLDDYNRLADDKHQL